VSTHTATEHKFFRAIPAGTTFDFARQRFFWLAVSVILIAGSIALYQARGLTLGIEFSGGADIQIQFDTAISTADLRAALEEGEIDGYSVQTMEAATDLNLEKGLTAGEAAGSASPEFLIKVKATPGEEIADTAARVRKAIEAKFGNARTSEKPEGKWEVRRQESASPAAVQELTRKGIQSILYSAFFIFLYIVVRFAQIDYASAIGYGAGAVVSLFHDVLVVFAAFVITGKEVTLPVVAAVLTVIGYSINDTIVIFDRMRENMQRHRGAGLWDTVNRSVNESLSRTIITVLTVVLVLLALFFLGGPVIHDFAFALLVGVTTGTYSSIFVASPTYVWTTQAIRRLQRRPAGGRSRTPRV